MSDDKDEEEVEEPEDAPDGFEMVALSDDSADSGGDSDGDSDE